MNTLTPTALAQAYNTNN